MSVTLAVSRYFPAPTLVQVNEYRNVVSVPSSVVPWKNWTRLTDPSLSEALAWMVMLAGPRPSQSAR